MGKDGKDKGMKGEIMAEESQGKDTFMDPDPNAKKPRLGFGKTLANYEELAEGLEQIEKQMLAIETRILGRREPTDTPTSNQKLNDDRLEPGYIERFDDVAVRIRTSVNSLSHSVDRFYNAI